MIPKRIVTAWIGTPDPGYFKPHHKELFMRCMESWRRFLPDYPVTVITHDDVSLRGVTLPQGVTVARLHDAGYCQHCEDQFLASRQACCVGARWLLKHGGVLLDSDVEVVRSFDELLDVSAFVGHEGGDPYVNTSVWGTEPGHWFAEQVLEHAGKVTTEDPNEHGPRLFTRLLQVAGWDRSDRLQDVHGLWVHPSEAFYPYFWNQRYDPSCVKPGTFAIHHWMSSWQQKVPV